MAWIDLDTGRPYTEKELSGMRATETPKTMLDVTSPAASSAETVSSDGMVSDFGGGAMASLQKTYLGLKQLGTYVTGDASARQAVNDEIKAMEEAFGPALHTTSGKVGEAVGTIGQFFVPGAILGRLAKSAPHVVNAASRLFGEVGGIRRAATTAAAFEGAQPISAGTTRTEDMLLQKGGRMLAGAAVGGGVGAAASRITRPGVTQAPSLAGIEKEAERIGFKGRTALTPAQRTGDGDLLQFEEGLLSSPGSQNLIRQRRNAQQDVLNKAASKALGYPKMDPTESVFGMARDNANLAYEPIASIAKLRTDVPYFDGLFKFAKDTDSDAAARVATKIRQHGSLTGSAFLEKLGQVRTMAFDASSNRNHYEADQFRRLGGIMEDFLERRLTDLSKKPGSTITADTIQQFKDARLQHSVISALEKSTDPVLGKVSAAKVLKEQFSRQRPGANASPTTQALQDISDISRVMRRTMPYIGSSGTAERLGGQRMVEESLNPLVSLRMAPVMAKNYLAARAYLAHGGQPGMFGNRLTPGQNAYIRRLLPPEAIGIGEALAD